MSCDDRVLVIIYELNADSVVTETMDFEVCGQEAPMNLREQLQHEKEEKQQTPNDPLPFHLLPPTSMAVAVVI
jgi:hypothetical protein